MKRLFYYECFINEKHHKFFVIARSPCECAQKVIRHFVEDLNYKLDDMKFESYHCQEQPYLK